MLLGNSHIKESLWEALLEGSEPSWSGHSGGNGNGDNRPAEPQPQPEPETPPTPEPNPGPKPQPTPQDADSEPKPEPTKPAKKAKKAALPATGDPNWDYYYGALNMCLGVLIGGFLMFGGMFLNRKRD